jgi:nitric oxide reductase NorE protein
MPAREETQGDGDVWSVFDGLPGHPMIWLLILSEFAVFGILLVAFCVARVLHPAIFAEGQSQLEPLLGAFNTLVLVTGGWLAARGSAAATTGSPASARAWLGGALLCGVVFVLVKIVEYAGEFTAGIGLETSTFFTLYFLLTGFHALHVVLGSIILAAVAWSADPDAVETGTAFWHMVDLVWLLMFPIVYLVH